MASKPSGPVQSEDTAWDQAIRSILRLARARRVTMYEAGIARTRPESLAETVATEIGAIERAAAVLRRIEPDLEVWSEGRRVGATMATSPAWLAIGVVWISTLVLAGLVVAGIVLLLR